jgi:farnesyl-diphosphate farnesyltransferase
VTKSLAWNFLQINNDRLVINLFKLTQFVKRQYRLTMPTAPPFKPPERQRLRPEHRRILRGVSRSFDLSIRLLPPALQAPVSMGYLLARATDTVADTSNLPLGERQILLDLMTQTFTAPHANEAQDRELMRLTQAFAAQQTDPNERALMLALPECLPLLQTLSAADQTSVQIVLGHITQGQKLDMTRFGTGLNALQSEDELAHYTWLVAGCVGEFWTELCERHLPDYSQLPHAEMLRLGREYGMGLQRLNIIRDTGADLAAGRCYWPQDTLAQAGLTPQMLAQAAQSSDTGTWLALSPLYAQWLDRTQMQLADGMRYALALQPLRLRLASALPALIGARTVALLRQAGPGALAQRVKIPRHEMRTLFWRLALGMGSCAVLDKQFGRWSEVGPR